MRKFFKILSVLLVFMIAVTALSGCNSGKRDNFEPVSESTQNDTDKDQSTEGEWEVDSSLSITLEPFQISKVQSTQSKYIEPKTFSVYTTPMPTFTYETVREAVGKESVFDDNYNLAKYTYNKVKDGKHYSDTSEYLYGSFEKAFAVKGCLKSSNENDYDNFSLMITYDNLSTYSNAAKLLWYIKKPVGISDKQIQQAMYNVLSSLVNADYAKYLIYGDIGSLNLPTKIDASDNSHCYFAREVGTDYVSLSMEFAPPKITSEFSDCGTSTDFPDFFADIKYNISSIIARNPFYDFDFKSNEFLKNYRNSVGIAYGDEKKNDWYPNKITVTTTETEDGTIRQSVYIGTQSALSSNIEFDYTVETENDKVTDCKFIISGISGNFSKKESQQDSFKRLIEESKKCINYFYPNADLSKIEIPAEIESNKKYSITERTQIFDLPGNIVYTVKANQSAIDTWVGSYEINFDVDFATEK